jgi:hypothetical protein
MYTDDVTGFVIRKPCDYKWDFAYKNASPQLVGKRREEGRLGGFLRIEPRITCLHELMVFAKWCGESVC